MESKDFDFSQLRTGQLETLRTKLRDFATSPGTGTSTSPGTGTGTVNPIDTKDPGCCHSSHYDTDGWI